MPGPVNNDLMESWLNLQGIESSRGGGFGGVTAEGRVIEEMRKNGMDAPSAPTIAPGTASGTTFMDMLRSSMDQVNTHQQQADRSMRELVAGRTKNVHETMLAIERADSSLKLMMQVRNKILDAYREIMRMQV